MKRFPQPGRATGAASTLALVVTCLATLASTGCKADLASEIILVVQTDMSLPKDIDTIDIQASDEGAAKFDNCFDVAGNPCNAIRLPATLGLLQPTDPTTSVTVDVDARIGGPSGHVQVFRQITTTVPTGRIVTMQMSVDFLCLGTAVQMADGSIGSTCAMGETCIAGSCVSQAVNSTTLDLYGTGSSVFGGGTCFDGASCWSNPQVADLDTATCSLPFQKDVNVALQTEGVGICGPVGCFVTLNANDPVEGWTVGSNGRIDLPPAVCTQIAQGKIVDVVTTPVTSTCSEKSAALPTCGPWSSAKKNAPAYAGPLTIAGGQAQPVALALDSLGDLYWINDGLTAGTDGTVKSVGPAGGTPTLIAGPTAMTPTPEAPRDLIVTGSGTSAAPVWTSATPANGMGMATGSILTFAPGAASPTTLYSSLTSPEGLAVAGSNLFWTDFQTNSVFMGPLHSAPAGTLLTKGANYPVRIVADGTYVYWTDEGTTGTTPPDGAIESFDYVTMTQPAGGQIPAVLTPRAIALEQGPNGTAVWYATFDADGSLLRAPVTNGVFGAPVVLASSLAYPNGIAIDGTNVYWTNRGAGSVPGSVQSLPLGAKTGMLPTTLATEQLAPGSIAVDDTSVYWVNAGTSTNPTGGVIKLPKP